MIAAYLTPTISPISWILVPLLDWDLPVLELLEKVDFVVSIMEVRKQFSVVSEIVDHVQESVAVSVQKALLIDFFDFFHTTEVHFQLRTLYLAQDISLGHDVLGSSHIKRNDLAVHLGHCSDFSFSLFPLLSLNEDHFILFVQLTLHVLVPLGQEGMIISDLSASPLKLHGFGLEFHIDSGKQLAERHFDLLNAHAPCGSQLRKVWNCESSKLERQRSQETKFHWILEFQRFVTG